MPRQVQILDFCDFCADVGQDAEPGVVLPAIAISGVKKGKSQDIIACERHQKDFQAIVEIILEYGQESNTQLDVPAGPKAVRGPRVARPVVDSPCVLCKEFFDREWSASNEESLRSHRANFHGIANSAYRLWKFELGTITIAKPNNPEDLTLTFKSKKIPAGVPAYLKCPGKTADNKPCPVEYDPHEKGEDSAFRSLANHTSRSHPDLPPLQQLLGT